VKLLLLKNRLKKGWAWLKHHWYVPLVVMALLVALLIWALTKNSMFVGMLMDVMENSRVSHRAEVDKLNEIHNRESDARKSILNEYNKNIELLEKEYAEKDKELDTKKKKEIKRLVKEGYNDPDKLARELANLYGLEHG